MLTERARTRNSKLEPTKEWTFQVPERPNDRKLSQSSGKRHLEREAVAKFIYDKFCSQLLTQHKKLTKSEAPPFFGEHIRHTNEQTFNSEKDNLQQRKHSSMRSQFIGLKKDLKQLHGPQQSQGIESSKFFRKIAPGFQQQCEGLSIGSPRTRSLMGSPRADATIPSMQTPRSERRQQKLLSHKERISFDPRIDNVRDFAFQTPGRPKIDKNIDNYQWQLEALPMKILRHLYTAKCIDLAKKNSKIVQVAHSVVFFDITIGDQSLGRIEMTLAANTPITSENFRALCTGEKGTGASGIPLHFKGCPFHRVIAGFKAQCGDFIHKNGTGSESIYGEKFKDENFKNKHACRGTLSMANNGFDSNGSQFFICFGAAHHLDNRHVVFGQVTKGIELLDAIEDNPTGDRDTPLEPVIISDCGQIQSRVLKNKSRSLRPSAETTKMTQKALGVEVDTGQLQKFCRYVLQKSKNRSVNVSNCYLQEQSATVLAKKYMLANQSIASYDLSFNDFGDKGVQIIAEALEKTNHVICLRLDMNNILWEGASHLANALKQNNSLIELSLSSINSFGNTRNRIMERGALKLSQALAVNRFLLILNLKGNGISNEGLSYLLPAIAQSDTLQSLNLSQNEITAGMIRQNLLKDSLKQGYGKQDDSFQSLRPFKGLQSQEVDSKEMTRQKFQTAFLIREFICRVESLKEFIIQSNKIGDEGMKIIAQAFATGNNNSVRLLDLTQTNITADSFSNLLLSTRANHTLSTLIVDHNSLDTAYPFSTIHKVISRPACSLEVLSCAHCNLSDNFGLKFAEALMDNMSLTMFNFYDNSMTCKTMTLIANAISQHAQCNLKEFNLGKNHIKDASGLKLAQVLPYLISVNKINLSGNNLTDETGNAINRNLPFTKILTELNLSKNLIHLRIIEPIQASLAKIRENKLALQRPNQIKQKEKYLKDREDARLTNKQISEKEAQKVRIQEQNSMLENDFRRSKYRCKTSLGQIESNQRQKELVNQEKSNQVALITDQNREKYNEIEIFYRNEESKLEQLKDEVKLLAKELAEKKQSLQKRQIEHQLEKSKLMKELENYKLRQVSVKSTIEIRSREVTQLLLKKTKAIEAEARKQIQKSSSRQRKGKGAANSQQQKSRSKKAKA